MASRPCEVVIEFTSYVRGHKVRYVRGEWWYTDTGELSTNDRPCGECNLHRTAEGHDGCLGTLPGAVMNACCGHGAPREAYIQYQNRSRLAGVDALRVFRELGRGPE